MDLVSGTRKLVVIMTHTNKNGAPKLVKECTLPLTGKNVIDTLITDMAVFEFSRDHT